jgi:hypothetical protein
MSAGIQALCLGLNSILGPEYLISGEPDEGLNNLTKN